MIKHDKTFSIQLSKKQQAGKSGSSEVQAEQMLQVVHLSGMFGTKTFMKLSDEQIHKKKDAYGQHDKKAPPLTTAIKSGRPFTVRR